MELSQIQERIRALPLAPGVYLFKDSRGRTIYVGKAARLRNRVRSYFGSKARFTPKVSRLVEHIVDFEFFVTASEEEALILELNFIKKFRPRYNISLKDDKSFPFLKIDPADGFPRVVITRRMTKDGGRYFGPFASAGSVRIVLQLIKRIFPLRSCTKPITGVDSRACLDYHIGRCVGPCIGAVDRAGYGALARQVTLFLEGRLDAVLRELRSDMASAARDLQYERAAMLRDQIRAVERVIGEQRIATTVRGDQDVIAFVKAGDLSSVQVFFIRHGRLTGRERFTLEGTRHEAPAQVVASFIKQFYSASTSVPPHFLLQYMPEDSRTIRQWLSGKRGGAVRFLAPARGARKRLVDTVCENARQEQEQRRVQDLSDPQTTARALEEVKEVLRLPRLPERVECYDVSDIGGTSAVGSMVVFEEGKPKRAHYRRFRIQAASGADDYAMMQEVLQRRFQRRSGASSASDGWAATPDLVLIDGGKGHLAAARKAMEQAGAAEVPTASIAKEKEEVFIPDVAGPLPLAATSPGLHLLQRIRDEAHRFAVTYHRKVRGEASRVSVLDSIPGIGPKRRRALLRQFGSLASVKEASPAQLAATSTMTRTLAERVKRYLDSYGD